MEYIVLGIVAALFALLLIWAMGLATYWVVKHTKNPGKGGLPPHLQNQNKGQQGDKKDEGNNKSQQGKQKDLYVLWDVRLNSGYNGGAGIAWLLVEDPKSIKPDMYLSTFDADQAQTLAYNLWTMLIGDPKFYNPQQHCVCIGEYNVKHGKAYYDQDPEFEHGRL
jgi:hypothetical protein